jgi:CubicO group peptidase (beta-lactamase class C family)
MATPGGQEDQLTFEDPAGRFSVPIPTNWTAESNQDYVLLQDPDKAIKMHILVVAGDSAEQAIPGAWAVIDPAFELSAKQTVTPPTAPGIDETVVITYDTGTERIVQAFAQRVKDQVFLILIEGSTDALVRRASQVQIVASGLRVKGQQETDLTNAEPKPLTPEMLAEFEAYLAETMNTSKVPGAAVAIVQNGEVVYLKGFGVLEMGKTDPITPDTPMMIGSTGKTMTTMMMATLVDDHKIEWDTPAIQVLPGFAVADPELSQKITMRNLVCACTGVPRRDLELIFNARHLTAEDVVASLRGFQFFTKFGEAFQYSNQMVGSGGYIAAVAGSGQSNDLYQGYVSQMQQRIFDPIGMSRTTFSFDRIKAAGDHATPHGLNLAHEYQPIPLSTEELLAPIAPAGASWSTASDMARYLITQINQGVNPDGQRVVTAENLHVTWEPQVQVSADASYALGWFVDEYKGLPLLHHGGNTLGFTTDLAFLPTAKLGIVVITNAQVSNLFNQAVRFRLFELVYNQPKEFDTQYQFGLAQLSKAIAEQGALLQKTLDEPSLEPYLGSFTNDALGTITVALADGKLTLTSESLDTELVRKIDKEGKTTYVMFGPPLAGAQFEFKTDDTGKPVIVLASPPDTYVFRPK